jgi:zinc protease
MIRLLCAVVLSLVAVAGRAEIDIREVTSPGGIDAWLVEAHEIPFVALEIRVRGGANLDEPGKRGAVNLMMALLEEGAGSMDAQAFQTERESLAASFGFQAYDDAVSISARFLTENRDQAIALLREAIVAPRFDPDAIERVRAQVLSGLQSDALDPGSIAGETFFSLAFPDHPYGTSMNGTEDSVAALTRDDLITAHRNALVRDRIYVGAVGDITAEDLGILLDELLGALPTEGPSMPPRVGTALSGGLTVVDYPTPQSIAIFGQAGMTRDDPDYFAAHIANHILGGAGFESRLMQEVREKRGLTYGIGTSLIQRDFSEMIVGSVASSNEAIGEAVDLVRSEWARMAVDGITQTELDRAKTYLTGEYPLRFDGNGAIAGILVSMQMIGLSPDYVINRNDYINAVSLDDINRVAGTLLRPEELHFVIVGQPSPLPATVQSAP